MALTGTDRGVGTHNTSASTLSVTPASDFGAGMAVLVVACDNAATNGVYSITTCTDSKGNTWTRRQSPLYDPGAALAGVQGAIFTTPQDGGLLTTGDTITVTVGAGTVAKAWTLMEVSGSGTLSYVTGGVNTGSATAAPTVTTGSIPVGDMVIAGLFNEHGTAQTVTEDGDSTNGAWSAQQTAEIGTTAAGMTVASQRKVVTAAATQTYNPTLGVSSDVILSWIQITETPAYDQVGYRGRNDDGSQTTATWKAAENTGWAQALDTPFRVRMVYQNNGGNDPSASPLFQLQYRKNGGAWTDVNASSSNVRAALSPNFTDGTRTTQQLSSGTGSFISGGGEMDEGNSRTGGFSQAFPPATYTEDEYSITLRSADLTTADLIELRAVADTVAFPAYSQIPQINGPPPETNALAEATTGTGAASSPHLHVLPRPAVAAGTAAANDASIRVSPRAAAATGAGTALGAGAMTPLVVTPTDDLEAFIAQAMAEGRLLVMEPGAYTLPSTGWDFGTASGFTAPLTISGYGAIVDGNGNENFLYMAAPLTIEGVELFGFVPDGNGIIATIQGCSALVLRDMEITGPGGSFSTLNHGIYLTAEGTALLERVKVRGIQGSAVITYDGGAAMPLDLDIVDCDLGSLYVPAAIDAPSVDATLTRTRLTGPVQAFITRHTSATVTLVDTWADRWANNFEMSAGVVGALPIAQATTFPGTEANGWGAAWSSRFGATAADYSVSGGSAHIVANTEAQTYAQEFTEGGDGYRAARADMRYAVRTNKLAVGAAQELLGFMRWTDANNGYGVSVFFNADQTISTRIARMQSSTWSERAATATASGLTHAAATPFWVRFQIEGPTATPTIRIKIWEVGDPEPETWTREYTDSGSTLTGERHFPGMYIDSPTSNSPVTASFEEFRLGGFGWNDDIEAILVEADAGSATATLSSVAAAVRIAPRAAAAIGSGATPAAATSVAPRAGVASGSGAALNATTRSDSFASAGVASVSGAAPSPRTTVAPRAASVPVAGASAAPSVVVAPRAAAATATGSAPNATARPHTFAAAGVAAVSGSSPAASVATAPRAASAAASGAAVSPRTAVAPRAPAVVAAAEATAGSTRSDTFAQAGVATVGVEAQGATAAQAAFAAAGVAGVAAVAPNAGARVAPSTAPAAVTSVAQVPSAHVHSPATPAAVVGTAPDAEATAEAEANAAAGVAAVGGATPDASASLAPSAEIATGTAQALAPITHVTVHAGVAAVAAIASDAEASVSAETDVDAEAASIAGEAPEATPAVSPSAEAAVGGVAAAGVSSAVSAHAGVAEVAASAGNVGTSTTDTADAEPATAAVEAIDVVPAVASVAEAAAGNAAAQQPGVAVFVSAGVAAVSASAPTSSAEVRANADAALAIATAFNPIVALAVQPNPATVSVDALEAVGAMGTYAAAGVATVGASTPASAARVAPEAAPATGSATAQPASAGAAVFVDAGVASVSGAASDVAIAVAVRPTPAIGDLAALPVSPSSSGEFAAQPAVASAEAMAANIAVRAMAGVATAGASAVSPSPGIEVHPGLAAVAAEALSLHVASPSLPITATIRAIGAGSSMRADGMGASIRVTGIESDMSNVDIDA